MRLLCVKLKELVNWENFGTNLGIEHHEIQKITKNNPLDIEGQKRDLFDFWLRQDITASWEKVEKALSDSQETVLAEKISLYMLKGEEENSKIPELPQVPNTPLPLDVSIEDTDSPPAASNSNTGTSEDNNNTSEGTCNNWQ